MAASHRRSRHPPRQVSADSLAYESEAVHPVEVFRRRLESLPPERYWPGLVPVTGHLQGTAFFAAAAGLRVPPGGRGLPPFPRGGVMFVGNNLDSERDFLDRLASGNAHGDPPDMMDTWKALYPLLDAADLDPGDCFFTNAYVGLIAGPNAEGDPKVRPGCDFDQWCAAFLGLQLETMRPRAVVALGRTARRALGRWLGVQSWRAGTAPTPGYVVLELGAHRAAGIALVHPSGHSRNHWRIRYGDRTGFAAEARLLYEATRLLEAD